MKDWTSPRDVKAKVTKDWDRGTLLQAFWPRNQDSFLYRLPLRGPNSTEWSDRFDEARRWIATLDGLPLEWREFTHPRLGRNKVPVAVVWTELNGLLGFLGKRKEAEKFGDWAQIITERFPALSAWVTDQPHLVLEIGEDWHRLLLFFDWLIAHPRPAIYLRQIDVPGVHTKFLESRRGVIITLLDLILPADAIEASQTGILRFSERYGFLSKPKLVRFRHLDPRHAGARDVTWRLDDWAKWESPPARVFITENEVNFLAFPDAEDAIVIFGAGYGFDGWERFPWWDRVESYYWGDLDTHGFAIIDQLRSRLPQVRSLMMDEKTLMAHRDLWGEEPKPTDRILTRLTSPERAVYRGLVDQKWGPNLRLEQERIGYRWVLDSLVRALLTSLLDAYPFRYLQEEAVAARFREFLASGEVLQGKSNPKRHITASTWIVNKERTKVLLTHHAKLDKWVQLGGHTDEGEDWVGAALREAFEESGLANLHLIQAGLYDLDIHEIPARNDQPVHDHYDLRFLVEADDSESLTISDESHDLAWVPLEDLERYTQEESQLRMKRKLYL